MVLFKIAEKEDLGELVGFLSLAEINNSFVKSLSQREITIEERVKRKYGAGVWILAFVEKELAGCLALVPNKDKIEISTYAVISTYRGQGIGSRLLDEAFKICKERYERYKKIILDSWEGNKAIERLMEKNGFRLTELFYDPKKRPPGIKTVVYERLLY